MHTMHTVLSADCRKHRSDVNLRSLEQPSPAQLFHYHGLQVKVKSQVRMERIDGESEVSCTDVMLLFIALPQKIQNEYEYEYCTVQ